MPATDSFAGAPYATSGPATNAVGVSPHDTNDLTYTTRAIYVGGAGNLTVTIGGTNVTLSGVTAGTMLPIRATKVLATGTTATSIVALW
jgi:hypothetical protein